MAATVLVGEVEPDLRDVFRLLLTRAGHAVLIASDGPSALDAAVRCRPDLVILNLYGEDGPDICRALHADSRTAGTPVILMSADLYPDAAAAADCGAEDYVTKPFDNADLLAHAHALLASVPGEPWRPIATRTTPPPASRGERTEALQRRPTGQCDEAAARERMDPARYSTP